MSIAIEMASERRQGRRSALRELGALLFLAGIHTLVRGQSKLTIALVNLKPWSATSPSGAPTGILVQAAREIERRSGQPLEIVLFPYARAVAMLDKGQVDLMLALETAHLNRIAYRVAPVAVMDIAMIARPGLRIGSIADLRGKRVGQLRQVSYEPVLEATQDIIKYEINSYVQGLRMLQLGRLDAVIGIRTTILYSLKAMRVPVASLGSMFIVRRTPVSLYMAINSVPSADVDRFRSACAEMQNNHALDTLVEAALTN